MLGDEFAGGNGTAADPYQISNVYELQNMSLDLHAHYVLVNNIDASETVNWNSGAGFMPIGKEFIEFAGDLDGRNHTITGLFMDYPTVDGVGLLGCIDTGGSVRNVGVIDCDVTGSTYAGGLVGWNHDGAVSNCQATGDVSAFDYAGALVGFNEGGTVSDCYATANVSTVSYYAGGLVGWNLEGEVTNSHSNIDMGSINGIQHNSLGGLYDAQFRDWRSNGLRLNISDYGTTLVPYGGYYEISSVQGMKDLLGFADVPDYSFRLAADIDLSSTPGYFIPLFAAAEFEGDNHTLSDLRIDLPNQNIGVFGVNLNGALRDIRVVNVSVSGVSNVGGLVGLTNGTISNCSVTGNVNGQAERTGGLVGDNGNIVSDCHAAVDVSGGARTGGLVGFDVATVSGSYAMGNVTGSSFVGGLIGWMFEDTVSNCYATGNVSGTNSIGGLMGGSTENTVLDCYATGNVNGTGISIGGLVGWNDGATISGCFWDTNTSGLSSSAGGTGRTTSEMKTRSTFTDADWDFDDTWCIVENVTYPLFRWQDVESPIADAGPDQVVDEDILVAFDGRRSIDDVGLTFVWTFVDTSPVVLHGARPAHVFNDPGIYTVTLNVTDAVGNWDTDVMIVTVNDVTRPYADAGPDVTVDEGTLVTFNGSASSDNVGVVYFTWTFTDGAPVTLYGAQPSHRFDTPGIFVVTLNVTDAAGNWGVDTMTVTVRDVTPPVADAGPDQTVEAGVPVAFNGSGSRDNVGVVDYTWTFDDGTGEVTLHGAVSSHAFRVPGMYAVTLNVADAAGLWGTDTMWVTVTDETPPVADAGPDQVVNQNVRVTFDGSASTDNVGIVEYTWQITFSPDTIFILKGVSPSYTFRQPGIYRWTLWVEDAAGLRAWDMMTVTVRDITSPKADAGPDQTVDEGTWVTFDGSNSTDNVGCVNYTWMFVLETRKRFTYGVSPSVLFEVYGVYLVTLNVTDAAGNWNEDTMALTVRDAKPPYARAGPDQAVPVWIKVHLDGSDSFDNRKISKYSWTFTYDGKPQVLEGYWVSFVFGLAGIYEVVLTVTDTGGNLDNDTTIITIVDTGWVTGIVLDTYWEPLEGATVEVTTLDGRTYNAMTDANGSFAVEVHYGIFDWKVSKKGYIATSGRGYVRAMGSVELDRLDTHLVKVEVEGPSILPYLMCAFVVGLVLGGVIHFIKERRHEGRSG